MCMLGGVRHYDQGSWDTQDLYAAVVKSVMVKVFLVLVAVQDLECHQFDFKTALLNATIPVVGECFVDRGDAQVEEGGAK